MAAILNNLEIKKKKNAENFHVWQLASRFAISSFSIDETIKDAI